MAYLEDIYPPKCTKGCGKLAKKVLRTNRNGHYGDYCAQHAGPMLKYVLDLEEQENARARASAENPKVPGPPNFPVSDYIRNMHG